MSGCSLMEKVKPPFKPARELDLTTTSGRLMDAILRHRHALLRAENGAAARLVAPLKEAQREILEELRILAARDAATGTFSNLRRERLLVMQSRIQKSLEFAEMEALGSLSKDLRSLQEREVEIQAALLRREIPAGISLDLVTPSPARLDRILNQPLGGTAWATRLHERYGDLVGGMTTSLAQSVQLGEGMLQAARRMNRVTGIGIRSSVVIARTEIQRVANETAFDFYVQNADVIKGIVIVETLDDRTCFTAGTGVLTPDGYRPIEELRPGDTVIGGSRVPRLVLGTRKLSSTFMTRMVLSNGTTVECTSGHQWLRGDQKWVAARNFVHGHRLANALGPESVNNVHVQSVESYQCLTEVYDIHVDVDESFIVADVVVHNCIICAVQDGKFIPLGQSGSIPPFHPNCRGFVSPVVRSLEEMGLPPLEFPASTRASMTGEKPQSLTYQEWFKGQSDPFQREMLGPTRFALFKSGDVSIDSMVKDFKIIPIANLRLPSVN